MTNLIYRKQINGDLGQGELDSVGRDRRKLSKAMNMFYISFVTAFTHDFILAKAD